ncbi:hypothetical protein BLOT_005315 [Blomia tropicalis]|nr:hypothetical protein BLOT_005315 [Blomia tropicalis]
MVIDSCGSGYPIWHQHSTMLREKLLLSIVITFTRIFPPITVPWRALTDCDSFKEVLLRIANYYCQSGFSNPKSIGSLKHYQNKTTIPNEMYFDQVIH